MKTKQLALIVILFTLFISCNPDGNDSSKDGENSTEKLEDLGVSDMNEFSFKPHGINLSILLPEVESRTGASIEPKLTHNDGDYAWYLDIGPYFKLVVEDFGKENNKVADEKKRLADLVSIFDYEYIIDEPNLIMYKRSLKTDQGGKSMYFCYGETTIEGYTYVLKSNDDGGLKPVIMDMVAVIKSAKEIQ